MATAVKKSVPAKSSKPAKRALPVSTRTPASPQRTAGAPPAKQVVPVKPTAAPQDSSAARTTSIPAAAAKPAKTRKPKLVRDSFTIPKAEYAVLDTLKQRAGALASPAKKSELLRAGIKALAAMNDAAFKSALQAVPAIKTGRPSQA